MKAIMVMFDSLNRKMLSPYGCDWTITPNFQRLAKNSVMFANNYAGSLPCMPARRELHTGRYNFLHRSWGPMEPFDDSMPEILKNNGVHSHLVSDHMHYWEDGGATYHTRYGSWEIVRGQEGDKWKVLPELFEETDEYQNDEARFFKSKRSLDKHDRINRKYMDTEEKMSMALTFKNGLEFIDNNREADNWFLQIECFDPHEPFYCTDEFKAMYPHEYHGKLYDWPPYHQVTEDEQTQSHIKYQYAALMSMCDKYLGKVLDTMDRYRLWEDTMLIVCTDHGYLLGEHGWWSKTVMPVYDEICHTPLFIYDPRSKVRNEQRNALTQLIDIPATILDYFGIGLPRDMQGVPLKKVIDNDVQIRECAMFGFYGAHINITDGTYVYMKAPISDSPELLSEYTLMPAHMRSLFSVNEIKEATLCEPFTFTKGCGVLKIPGRSNINPNDLGEMLNGQGSRDDAGNIDNNCIIYAANLGDKLYNLITDPQQNIELNDPVAEARMANMLIRMMKENDCPPEQFARIGLNANGVITPGDISLLRENYVRHHMPDILANYEWSISAANTYRALINFTHKKERGYAAKIISDRLEKRCRGKVVEAGDVLDTISDVIPEKNRDMVYYFVSLSGRVN